MSQIETTDLDDDNSRTINDMINGIIHKDYYYIITFRFATKKESGTRKKRKIYDEFIDFVENYSIYDKYGKGYLDDTTSTVIIKTKFQIEDVADIISSLYDSECEPNNNDHITLIGFGNNKIENVLQFENKDWTNLNLNQLLSE